MNADPQTPPNEDGLPEEEARESGPDLSARNDSGVSPAETTKDVRPAADRLLPPFLLVQAWEPDAYDEVLLEWWGEGYLMECGSMHADERLAQHDHGRVLALVVLEAHRREECILGDWVQECREIAGVTEPVPG